MKKVYYIIIAFVSFMCIYNKVDAAYEAKTDESNLLAKCQYDYKTPDGETRKIVIDITKDYGVGLAYTDIFTRVTTGNQQTDFKFLNFTYDLFINENSKIKCLDKIYYYGYIEGIGGRGGRNLHVFQPGSDLIVEAPYYATSTECLLNESASTIYVSDNYDEEVIENEGWLRICHYGSLYLKFNKTIYETNIDPLVSHFGIDPEPFDVMSFIIKNNYSCPTTLMKNVQNLYGGTVIKYMFKMDYDPKGITSQDFVSEYRCGSLDYHMKDYENLKKEDEGLSIAKLNEKIKIIQDFCSSVYENLDYDDKTYCVKECLEIDEIFAEDAKFGENSACGISGKIVIWIANIVRWVKYLIPVAVIVLGILDFMKAISADKEDEMKKAQRRFIIRLIAAALIFIIPFILEFVLEKMGFAANGCGIINL